jgi:modification target Cys-rich repeat protein
MKKYVCGLGALVAPSLIGAMVVVGCGEDGDDGLLPGDPSEVCGPCGTIATGDIGISGDARLDGFFKALGTMQNATVTIQTDFDANIRALAALYPSVDLPEGALNAQAVGLVTAAIQADIEANVQGELVVDYQPARCQANVNVAVQAQAKCEAKAECDVMVNPGQASVVCEGKCTGSCEGECTGELACEVDAGGVQCMGQCEGACTLEAAAECNGTCRGECNGTCSAEDGMGNCAGKCEGTCEGTCELAVAAECSGTCTGKCLVDPPMGGCEASATCRGSCEGSCTGGCEGNFTPPSASAECMATAACQASAKAEANASLDCTPPQLKIDYALNGAVSAEARAQFTARLAEVKARGAAIVQGLAKYRALVTGEAEVVVDGQAQIQTVFNPSPAAALAASVRGFATASAFAEFDVPAVKIPCVIDAVAEAGPILTSLTTGTAASIEAQAAFVGEFTTGFSG